MAKPAGASFRLVAGADAKIADGTREVTDDVYSKDAQALLGEIERMNKATNRVGEIAGAMLADLDGEK